MCIFSGPVVSVNNTKIFATVLGSGDQFTVYRNDVEVDKGAKPVAMVLPLPNPTGEPNKIRMFDMGPYAEFFDDLEGLFEVPARMRGGTFGSKGVSKGVANLLPILKCGLHDYSVADTFNDLARLDWDRYEMTPAVQEMLSLNYGEGKGFGFLVCICTETGAYPSIGVIHPTMANGDIFLPTMHEHGGGVEAEKTAEWDHSGFIINCGSNVEGVLNTTIDGGRVNITHKRPANASLKLDFTKLPIDFPQGLTDGNAKFLVGFNIAGEQDNGDLVFINSGLLAEQRWKQCSYNITGSHRYATQASYRCTTCYPWAASGLGLCSYCANDHSKQGHKVKPRPDAGGFYCDARYLAETKAEGSTGGHNTMQE